MGEGPLKIMAVTGSRADWGYLSVPLSLPSTFASP